MKFTPIEDRVSIKPLEAAPVTKGGILLPDSAQEKPRRGRVLAVGPGKLVPNQPGGFTRLPMTVKVGDLVCYSAYAGHEVGGGDEKILVMGESEVFGIISE